MDYDVKYKKKIKLNNVKLVMFIMSNVFYKHISYMI